MQGTNFISDKVSEAGSVRVDLVGGTLDLEPINLILPNVVTLNVATSLKAEVTLQKITEDQVEINSLDYDTHYIFKQTEITTDDLYYHNTFKEMTFVLQILDLFGIRSGLRLDLKSGAPAGSGLGGSSAMGVTLYKALCQLTGYALDIDEAVLKVKSIEGRILNRGVPGYQDYFPAVMGGILSLKGVPGRIDHEQLYSDELCAYLEKHITLVYSGISRNSGINNWDVYKSFFDGDEKIRTSLTKIAEISFKTYQAIKNKTFSDLLELIGQEGQERVTLASNIVPQEVKEFTDRLLSDGLITGMKMCGAGGGGCFIVVHQADQRDHILNEISKTSYTALEFKIDKPL